MTEAYRLIERTVPSPIDGTERQWAVFKNGELWDGWFTDEAAAASVLNVRRGVASPEDALRFAAWMEDDRP